MSPPDGVGSFPVVHHFYPIDPVTSSQQSSLVYNSPSDPVVAPIRPMPYPLPRESNKDAPKRKRENDEQEVEDMVLESPPRRRRRANKRPNHPQRRAGVLPVRLPPRRHRLMAYIEVPILKSTDRRSYKPLSRSSRSVKFLTVTEGGRLSSPTPSLASWKPESSPPISISSDSSFDPDSDGSAYQTSKSKGKRTGKKTQVQRKRGRQAANVLEDDDASTCHQCRRKSAKMKMRCRKLRKDGNVCGLNFCQHCVQVRYGEEFDPDHRWWHCPRCRGICNCSICLRKAGLGFVLDNMSQQLSGVQGRLSAGRRPADSERVSVHELLTRRGIAPGTDKRMKQGIRPTVVSLPPTDNASPYDNICCDDDEEQDADSPGFPLDPQLVGDNELTTPVKKPRRDTQDHDARPCSKTPEKTPETGSKKGTSMDADAAASSIIFNLRTSTSKEYSPSQKASDDATKDDLSPSPTRTPRVRLLLDGHRYGSSSKPNSESPEKSPNNRKRKKRRADSERDYRPDGRTPVLTIRVRPVSGITASNDDEKLEYKDEDSDSESSTNGSTREKTLTGDDDDAPATPSPPPEPTLVPNEHYTPSKLDPTRVTDASDSRFKVAFWAGPEQNTFTYTFSNDTADADVSPSRAGTTVNSTHHSSVTSSSHLLNDEVTRVRDSAYVASGLSSYINYDETWTTGGGSASGSGIAGDPPSLQLDQLVHGTD